MKWSELSKSYGFKVICFFVLLTNHIKAYYADDKIFDFSDEMIVKKLETVKEFFTHEGNISEISLESFYLRVVSRKPNW